MTPIHESPHHHLPTDQRNMGMSMRVERSTLDQVKKRFEFNKKKKEEDKKKYGRWCQFSFLHYRTPCGMVMQPPSGKFLCTGRETGTCQY